MKNRALIFVNGEIENLDFIREMIETDDFLIAADGGSEHLKILGINPNLLIGDLDSVVNSSNEISKQAEFEVQKFPREKDETDLELALRETVKRGFSNLVIVAALGGRLDQTLGNLALLQQPFLDGYQVTMEDGINEIHLVRSEITITGKMGDIVSLLAVNQPAVGVITKGLKYPLKSETLYPYQTRGISNEMLSNTAYVALSQGQLLSLHTRNNRIK